MDKCRYCHRPIAYNSLFCNWCGGQQIVLKQEVKVPRPKIKNGHYCAQVCVNNNRIYVSANTEEEYYKKARELKTGKISPAATITLAEGIRQYDNDKSARLDVRTKEAHEYIINNRFKSLMNKKLCDITATDLDKAIDAELKLPSRKGGTIKPKTVNDAMGLIKAVLKRYADFNDKVDAVVEKKTIKDYPTVPEVVQAITGTDIELPCLLALWLGMSMEEIRGLTKSKSLQGNRLCIVEKVVDTKNGAMRIAGGKAVERVRAYVLPEYLKQLIDNVDGDIIEKRSGHAVYMRLQIELKRNGVKLCSFHDLRHLNTATMTSANIPSKTIQQRNGWSSDRMIKEVYDYVFDADRQACDDYMNNYFNNIINGGRAGKQST